MAVRSFAWHWLWMSAAWTGGMFFSALGRATGEGPKWDHLLVRAAVIGVVFGAVSAAVMARQQRPPADSQRQAEPGAAADRGLNSGS